MINKRELTKKFLNQLSLPEDTKNVRKHHVLWWQNTRTSLPNRFRLTDVGYKMLVEQLKVTNYKIDFPKEMEWTVELILNLDKFLETPYYIESNSIIVFMERPAVELILFGGDLQKYGLARAKSHKKTY